MQFRAFGRLTAKNNWDEPLEDQIRSQTALRSGLVSSSKNLCFRRSLSDMKHMVGVPVVAAGFRFGVQRKLQIYGTIFSLLGLIQLADPA